MWRGGPGGKPGKVQALEGGLPFGVAPGSPWHHYCKGFFPDAVCRLLLNIPLNLVSFGVEFLIWREPCSLMPQIAIATYDGGRAVGLHLYTWPDVNFTGISAHLTLVSQTLSHFEVSCCSWHLFLLPFSATQRSLSRSCGTLRLQVTAFELWLSLLLGLPRSLCASFSASRFPIPSSPISLPTWTSSGGISSEAG